MHPEQPNNALKKLPPSYNLESPAALKTAIRANRALATLNGYCSLLPNSTILLNTIILSEARASSEIENIVTTHDELYRAMAAESQDIEPAAKEVLNYNSALWRGVNLLREKGFITTNIIEAVQRELEQNDAGVRRLPGTALVNELTGEIVYTPPDNERVIRDLLYNLERFLNTDEHPVDPLIKMAVAHYQFEAIHPFYDGNGRTGRILNVLYLMQSGLLDSPILYLSRHIIRGKSRYYSMIQRIHSGEGWEEWIEFMLEAVERTARTTLETIKEIMALLKRTIEQCRGGLPKTTYSKDLIELLFIQPYTKIEHLVDSGIAERRTASKYLRQLELIGVLTPVRIGKYTVYINHRLMDILRRAS